MYEVDYRGVKISCYAMDVAEHEAVTFEVKSLADKLLAEHEKDVDNKKVREIRFDAEYETREYAINNELLERETYITIEAIAVFSAGDISIPERFTSVPENFDWKVTGISVYSIDGYIEVEVTFKKSFKVKTEQFLFRDLYFRGEIK